MIFEYKKITLKNGKEGILRPAVPEDSEELLKYLKTITTESRYVLNYPDEVNYTLEGESEILGRLLKDPSSVMMVAEVEGRIAGNCSVNSLGRKRKIRHRCSYAIALYKEFWNLGIGSCMTVYACELAKQIGYEQIELEVIEGNGRGRRAYEKAGFTATGKLIDAFKYDDGTYENLIVMSRKL